VAISEFASSSRVLKLIALFRFSKALLLIGAFCYAALFTTEGIGLWLEKRWAEYLTVIATISFIPFEVWEIVRRVTVLRIALVIANIAIVIDLIWRLTRQHGLRRIAS